MDKLKDEVSIIKDLPPNLKLLDVEAAGSLVCFPPTCFLL